MLSRGDDDRCKEIAARVSRWGADPDVPPSVRDDLLFLLTLLRRLEADRIGDSSVLHDKLQDLGREPDCLRCRLEGRREGLLEAAEMLEGRPFGPHTSPHIDAPLLKAAARLRALAGQVDNSTGGGVG